MGTTLLERIDGVTGLVRERADEVAAGRRITDDVLAAIRGTGLNRTLLPRSLGGGDARIDELTDAIARLAAVDGSTAWCAAIGAGSNVFAGYLPEPTAKEVFSDPDQPNASMFGPFGTATPAGDAYSFSGRWPFSSNCLHSGWIGLGSWFLGADGEQEPIPRLSFVPMSEVEVEDTWTAPGLAGTGSHHTKVSGVPLTRDHSLAFIDQPWAEGVLWRMPLFCVLGPCLGVVPMGIARGAVDEVARLIREGATRVRGGFTEDPSALADFAMADARLRAAKAGFDAALAEAWSLAERGERPSAEVQARVMASMSLGCEVAVDATATAHRLAGGAAAYAGNRLLRSLHDVQTARQHIMFGFNHRPVFGQALAGLPTFAPPMIL